MGAEQRGPWQPGVVSVVVAVYNVEAYLAEALDSLLAQEDVTLDVVLVDDGSTDASGEIAARFATADPRVRLVRQPNAGLGAARNTGLAHASGEFLAFFDPDDLLPARALATMVDSLRTTGSDFAIGRLERFDADRSWQPVWIRESHADGPHLAVTIEQHPVALKDVIACNRLFRRAFWEQRTGRFAAGTAYEDHVPMVAAYLEGARFDVLEEITYRWRVRDDGGQISQAKFETGNLADRVAVLDDAWRLVAGAPSPVRAVWLARALELDLANYYRYAPSAPERFRDLLADAASRYLDLADDAALRWTSTHRSVSAWLAMHGHWEALDWLENGGGIEALRERARLVGDWLVADAAPLVDRYGVQPPERVLGLSYFDTSVRTSLVGARWRRDDLSLEIAVGLRGSRLLPEPEILAARLVERRRARRDPAEGGANTASGAATRASSGADGAAGSADGAGGSRVLPVPVALERTPSGHARLAAVVVGRDLLRWAGGREITARLEVELGWGAVRRAVGVDRSEPGASEHLTARIGRGWRLEPRFSRRRGLRILVRRAPAGLWRRYFVASRSSLPSLRRAST